MRPRVRGQAARHDPLTCRHRNAGIWSTSATCAACSACHGSWMSVTTGMPSAWTERRISSPRAMPGPLGLCSDFRLALSKLALKTKGMPSPSHLCLSLREHGVRPGQGARCRRLSELDSRARNLQTHIGTLCGAGAGDSEDRVGAAQARPQRRRGSYVRVNGVYGRYFSHRDRGEAKIWRDGMARHAVAQCPSPTGSRRGGTAPGETARERRKHALHNAAGARNTERESRKWPCGPHGRDRYTALRHGPIGPYRF